MNFEKLQPLKDDFLKADKVFAPLSDDDKRNHVAILDEYWSYATAVSNALALKDFAKNKRSVYA